NALTLEVRWPSGARSVVHPATPNRAYEIEEPAGVRPPPEARPPTSSPWFKEVTSLTHEHHDEAFDDFARQPLLPRRLSQLGPGVAWIDIDGDGREDLVVGSGRGGSLAIFRNRGDGAFDAMRVGGVLGQAPDDQTTILGWASEAGLTELVVGQA